jgi:hypothetical protein
VERAEGQLNEAQSREEHHRDATHYGYGSPTQTLTIGQRLSQIRERLALADQEGVRRGIFDLSPINNGWQRVPDEVVEGLLSILRDHKMFGSHLAGDVLNYFEFESPHLTPRQKQLCVAFIEAHGDSFRDVLAMQVVIELRKGLYLR